MKGIIIVIVMIGMHIITTGIPPLIDNQYPHYTDIEKYINARLSVINISTDNNAFGYLINQDYVCSYGLYIIDSVSMNELADALTMHLQNIDRIVVCNATFVLNILMSELYRIDRQDVINMLINKNVVCLNELSRKTLGRDINMLFMNDYINMPRTNGLPINRDNTLVIYKALLKECRK